MIASSNNLYDLIKNSKIEILSVTQRYGYMPDEIHRITTYNFIKDLEHLVKSGVFNNIDWNFERISDDILLLTSQPLAHLCNIRLTHSVKAASNASRVLFIKDGEVFYQLYRGNLSNEEMYQKISDTLTALTTGGDRIE